MQATEVHARRGEVEILDVREQDEWEAGRIDGARHLPMGEMSVHFQELPRDRLIVTVCRSGNRSGKAAEMLRAKGFAAEGLDGGLTTWVKAGLPIATGGGQPGRVI